MSKANMDIVQARVAPAMRVEGLSVTYDGKPALADVSLAFAANRLTAIIGPSGCGKSTLLQSLNGMLDEEPSAKVRGRILLGEDDTARLPREELRRRVGLVFQTPAPFPFSIYKNVSYVLKYHGRGHGRRAQMDALVREELEAVGLYDEVRNDLDKSALKLSGGQQQRLCIARALAARPEVLLLDEPCSALDVRSSAVIEELLGRLKHSYTIVVVTHNIAQARRIADDVVFLYDGRLVETGAADELFKHPRQERTRAFLEGLYG